MLVVPHSFLNIESYHVIPPGRINLLPIVGTLAETASIFLFSSSIVNCPSSVVCLLFSILYSLLFLLSASSKGYIISNILV